ncbi:MAG TPA: hypothetical protein DD414_07685 [Lachnospiraceae bacterium]|nr:hypothetical protein [Lachnospiraceae bacterium]
MNYKITNGQLLVYTEDGFKVEKKDLYIEGDKIAGIGACDPAKEDAYETVDASDKLIMPGLINMHTHAYMTTMRNYADDVDFDEWLFKRVMPVEDRLPKEAAYWSSLLGCMEMIRTGTTAFVDMHMYCGQSPKAAQQAGMRAFIGRGLVGEDLYEDGYSRLKEALEEKEAYESDLIRFVLSPHAIYSCSEKLYVQVAEEANKRGMLKQTHLSESVAEVDNAVSKYGRTPVKLLSDLGFLDQHTILAHCVQMRGDDMEILQRSGAHAVTNPASNAKLGNGFAPVVEMDQKGINLCIGTDGTASNNTLNMFREMGLLSLIHKGIHKDSTSAPAQFVLKAATVNAAKALGMEHQTGVIETGACADLNFVDLKAVSLFPNNNIVSSLCYSANGSEVDSVMIGGKFVMKNKEMLTIDTERVYYEMNKIINENL